MVLEKFDAALVLDVIERYRITDFTATPTMLARIADMPGIDSRDLSSVDWILQGAAVMPPSLLRRWFDLLGAERIVMAYGMTENLGLTALRGDEWLRTRAASAADSGTPRSGSSTPSGEAAGPASSARSTCARR